MWLCSRFQGLPVMCLGSVESDLTQNLVIVGSGNGMAIQHEGITEPMLPVIYCRLKTLTNICWANVSYSRSHYPSCDQYMHSDSETARAKFGENIYLKVISLQLNIHGLDHSYTHLTC